MISTSSAEDAFSPKGRLEGATAPAVVMGGERDRRRAARKRPTTTERYDVVKKGEVLENPATGQRIVFKQTSRDTDGALLEVESVYTKPSPSKPPVHYHPAQEEVFEVLTGELHAVVGGEERTLGEGETLVISSGTPHEMWAEREGVRVSWQTRPALETESFFETVFGLASEGKTDERGTPNLLQAAVIAEAYSDEFRLVKPPWPVLRLLFAVLALIGRMLGYRACYPA